MGALHAGHASLVKAGADLARSRRIAAGCIVTIFVNPTQFNDPADFERYPKTLDADLDLCDDAGATAIFVPEPDDIYPPHRPVPIPPLPDVATRPLLEDRFRPGHFAGVCQVVQRLFDLAPPSAALFGEKDWQQLQVIRAMVRSSGRPIDIVGMPTIREADGLAMSSRNRFLSAEQRAVAAAVPRALAKGRAAPSASEADAVMAGELRKAGLEIEYATIRHAESLLAPVPKQPARALVAVRLGSIRLIDNGPWGPSGA